MPNNDTTGKSKGKKAQKPSALEYACQPAAISTACQPGTWEGSPSPYDNTRAEDDSAAVTATGGPPLTQHMMSPAVQWDGGASYIASPGYVDQQPVHYQQPMTYETPYYQESFTGTQGGSSVVDQQPAPNPPMDSGYYEHPGGEGQPPPGQQHGYPQHGYPRHGNPQHESQPYDYSQGAYYGDGGRSA